MSFPLISIFYLFFALMLFFFTWRTYRICKKSPSPLAEHFKSMAFFAGVGSLVYALTCIFFTDNSFALGIGNIIGETFYRITFVYGITTFFYLTFPRISSKKVIKVGLIFAILATISHIKFFPRPVIGESGIPISKPPIVPGITFALFSAASLLPLSFAFAREAIKERRLRTKSGLMSSALIFIMVSGGLQSLARTPQLYIFTLVLSALAYALLFSAAILQVKEENRA